MRDDVRFWYGIVRMASKKRAEEEEEGATAYFVLYSLWYHRNFLARSHLLVLFHLSLFHRHRDEERLSTVRLRHHSASLRARVRRKVGCADRFTFVSVRARVLRFA